MDKVGCYVKNHNVGFIIRYTLTGEQHDYTPDSLVCIDDGAGDFLILIIEVRGEDREGKAAKVGTARNCWLPTVANHRAFGRWAFLDIRDPWDTAKTIRSALSQGTRRTP